MSGGTAEKEAAVRKPTLVCMTHLPPPINGVTMMGLQVAESHVLRKVFSVSVIHFRSSDEIDDIGKLRITKGLRALSYARQLFAACISLRPALVYFTITPNGAAFYRDLIYVLILKLLGQRHVFHLHGKGVATASANFVARCLYRWAFRDAHVIALSQTLYDDLSGVVTLQRCHFLANGLPDCFASSTPRHRDSASGPVHVLFLSNLVESKGPLLLLEAFGILARQGCVFRATFVGVWESPSFKDRFESRMRELGLSDIVSCPGPKYGQEKHALLTDADIFAFPTYNDAYPLVVLEAMSHGLPVVSTYEGAIADMVLEGETGYLVPRHDIQSLAGRLYCLIQEPELRIRFGAAGRIRFREHFTDDIFERNLTRILAGLAGLKDGEKEIYGAA